MKPFLAIVLLAFAAGACGDSALAVPTASSTSTTSPATTATAPREIRVLVLGDSYAVGEGVGPDEAWPAQLTRALDAQGVVAEVDVIGATGWTSQRVATEVYRTDPVGPYDLVVIGVGVNDHFNQYGTAHLETGVRYLLDEADGLVSDPRAIVLLSIVDWRATPRGRVYAGTWRDGDIASYNEVVAALADAGGHRYVDITGLSLAQADDPSLIAADGLHASAALYEQWVGLLLPMVLEEVE